MRWITVNGGWAVAFNHESDEQARDRYARIEAHRESLFEYTDPRVRAAFAAHQSVRKQMDADNTVIVSSGQHVIPALLADALAAPMLPTQAGTHGQRNRARMALRIECAGLLGIPLFEVADVIAQLRRARRFRATR
jgi:hypothetical protein